MVEMTEGEGRRSGKETVGGLMLLQPLPPCQLFLNLHHNFHWGSLEIKIQTKEIGDDITDGDDNCNEDKVKVNDDKVENLTASCLAQAWPDIHLNSS